ncbi:MAG: hypothetical protein H6Q60_1098 [Oscillospiraceae bacterium]|nr:hypothetical protein [Oscillospiraceae bacterium]
MSGSHYKSGMRIAAVSLAALFVLVAMGILLAVTGVYRSVTDKTDTHFTQYTAVSYVLNQLRRGDAENAFSIVAFGDGDALQMEEQDGYRTLLYCWNGSLMELYTGNMLELTPDAGESLLSAQTLALTYENNLLTVTVTNDDGTVSTVSYAPRSESLEGGGV